jgi:hypothetical protein
VLRATLLVGEPHQLFKVVPVPDTVGPLRCIVHSQVHSSWVASSWAASSWDRVARGCTSVQSSLVVKVTSYGLTEGVYWSGPELSPVLLLVVATVLGRVYSA